MWQIGIGVILDMIIGDPHNPYHPIRFIGYLASFFEKIFRKLISRNLKLAGFGAWISIVGITMLISLGIVNLIYTLNNTIGIIIEGIIIYFCISAKGLMVEGIKVIRLLQKDNIEAARKQLSYIVGRDTNSLDREAIIRAVIETIAENMSDGIIAPIIFATIGGAPLAMTYKAVNTCDSMFGYKNDKYIDFGYVSAKMDDLFNYIPARITGYLVIIAAFVLKLNYRDSYKVYKRDRYNHTSPNSAHPEASVAGALGIRLGGSNYYFGKLVNKPTIGDDTRRISIDDVESTNRILITVTAIAAIVSISIRYIVGGII